MIILIEDILLKLPLNTINRYLNIYFNRDNNNKIIFLNNRYFIRRVINI